MIETAEHSHLNSEISDQELYKLLERQGRDVPFSSMTDSALDPDYYPHNDNDSGGLDALEKAQISLRDRMNLLKEVDLRQLGSVFYDKRKRKSTGNADIDIIICANDLNSMVEGKRIRKERIVMVDGKGSGYGNSVPILSENIEKESGSGVNDTSTVASLRRSRPWSHQEFCVLCGINPANDRMLSKSATHGSRVLLSECDMTPLKCAHCPFIFHSNCIAPPQNTSDGFKNKKTTVDIPRTTGTFICPHHRCCLCNRSTAAAGGLLFRCIGCLTSYCEDCLPQVRSLLFCYDTLNILMQLLLFKQSLSFLMLGRDRKHREMSPAGDAWIRVEAIVLHSLSYVLPVGRLEALGHSDR